MAWRVAGVWRYRLAPVESVVAVEGTDGEGWPEGGVALGSVEKRLSGRTAVVMEDVGIRGAKCLLL